MKNFLNKFVITTSILISFGITEVSPVKAAVLSVTNNNSSISVSTDSSSGLSGLFDWFIDGVDQMSREWFWFRIGNTESEKPLNTLPLTASGTQGNMITLQYADTVMKVDVTYTLNGGPLGSGKSEIAEDVKITNLTGQNLDLHWFNYTDLEVNGTFPNDTATALGSPNAKIRTIIQEDPIKPGQITVTSSRLTDHWEINTYPAILDNLNDNLPTTLSDTTSPFGPTDITHAFQYDVNIPANSGFSYQKFKIASVPEPSTFLSLLTLGTLGAASTLKRKLKPSQSTEKETTKVG